MHIGNDVSDRLVFPVRSVKDTVKRYFCFLSYHIINRRSQKSTTRVKTIEFICNGNICRSAFAEKYATGLLAKMGYSIKSSSSGIWAKEGTRSPAKAIKAASVFNVDLGDHISKKTDDHNLKTADLVFCMHFNQYRELCRKFPVYREKFFLLKAFIKPICIDINIEDPYGKNSEQYLKCFREISRSIEMAVGKIINSAE